MTESSPNHNVPKEAQISESIEFKMDPSPSPVLNAQSSHAGIGIHEGLSFISPTSRAGEVLPAPQRPGGNDKLPAPHTGNHKLGIIAGAVGSVVLASAGIIAAVGLRSKNNEDISPETLTPTGVPTATVESVNSTDPTPEPSSTVEKIEPIRVSRETFEYFKEIGLKMESSGNINVTKWMEDPKIRVHGTLTETDRAVLQQIIDEINELQGQINLQIVEESAEEGNLDVYFDSLEKFQEIEPLVPYRNTAFFIFDTVPYDEEEPLFSRKISKGRVFLATQMSQSARNSAIREEITQVLGLPNDADIYPDSIFRQTVPNVQEYSNVDKQLISFLYDPRVKPGMDAKELEEIIEFQEK